MWKKGKVKDVQELSDKWISKKKEEGEKIIGEKRIINKGKKIEDEKFIKLEEKKNIKER